MHPVWRVGIVELLGCDELHPSCCLSVNVSYTDSLANWRLIDVLTQLQHARQAGAAIRPHLDLVQAVTVEEDRRYPDHPPSRVGLLA